MFAVQAEGASITTIEGMANADGSLHAAAGGLPHGARPAMRLLHARHDHARASRCCRRIPNPSEEEIRFGISGNLCRCTGYQNIVKAIQYAAAKMSAAPREGGCGMTTATLTREAARSQARRHGLQAQAGGGHPLHPGQGQLHRRSEAARHAVRRFRALAVRACQDQAHRHAPRR